VSVFAPTIGVSGRRHDGVSRPASSTGRATASPPPHVEIDRFRTADGLDLGLTWRRRSVGAGGQDEGRQSRVVVVVPGLFTSRDCPEHRAFAGRIAEVADVVSLDVRGHGDSAGAFSWGLREPDDIGAFVASLRGEYERVGAVGFSFGGYHVAAAAAVHRSFDAVAMVATPRCFSILDRHFLVNGLRRSLAAARRRRGSARQISLAPFRSDRRPATALVGSIAPTPLLIVHGTRDWLLGSHHAHDLFRHAAEPRSLVFVQDAPHAEGMMVEHADRLVLPLLTFFGRTL
jgi:pimeloyl-ACP methyl ester carboxylesterase